MDLFTSLFVVSDISIFSHREFKSLLSKDNNSEVNDLEINLIFYFIHWVMLYI